ncbi:MAG: DUF1569 domain-containing protein [Singulisphaera sp.]
MATRRPLEFQSLEEVMPDVERLLAGHGTAGQWSLAQICNHLAMALRSTARPPREMPAATPEQSVLKKRFFSQKAFPPGRPAPAPFVPRDDLDIDTEVAALADAIKLMLAADGPFPSHPYLGPLSREEWLRFHTMHAEHHLSFAVPNTKA